MKKLIVALTICGLLSCSTTKKASTYTEAKTTDQTEADVSVKTESDSSSRQSFNWQEQLERAMWNESQIRLYDTSKPVDSATGLPPVLADLHMKAGQSEKSEKSTEVVSDQTNIVKTDSKDKSHYNKSSDLKTEAVVKTKKSVPWWIYAILAVAIIVIWKSFKKNL